MKNTFLIFVSIFFVFTVGIQAKTRIVEKPSYVYSSTTMLEIPCVIIIARFRTITSENPFV